MKAENTVLDRFDIAKMIDHILVDNPNAGGLYLSYKIAERQAEISFKSGYEEGRLYGKQEALLSQAIIAQQVKDAYQSGQQQGFGAGVYAGRAEVVAFIGDYTKPFPLQMEWKRKLEEWGIK